MREEKQGSDVREQVSKAYARALSKSQKSSCAPACCAPPPSVAAESAGYDAEKEKFADAAASSFGCGNPLAFAGVEEGQTVLDLGSGAGFDLLIAAEKVGPGGRVIGVDMTDEMIAAARANVAKAGFDDRVEVRKGHIEALPVDDASVDWVISNCVINLSPDKPAVFREVARVLKPGGRFSVSDIVVESLPDWLREHEAAYAACVAGAIPEDEYLGGLREAGLTAVEVTERLVYDEAQIRAMIANDLESFGLDEDLLKRGLAEVEGKVASVKVVGRR
jgi:ubiquinone/menaquinone biosynthesis C-methylase UbiE